MLYATYSLDKCILLCEDEFRDILEFLQKGINYACTEELKTGLNADKFVTFWMYPKRFYHSFALPLNTLEAAEPKYTCAISKHMKTSVYESG